MNAPGGDSETPKEEGLQSSMPSARQAFDSAVVLPEWSLSTDNESRSDTGSEAADKVERRIVPPLVHPTFPKDTEGIFTPRQRWEGIVSNVGDETFEARLIDKTGASDDEIVELPLDVVSRPDMSLVSAGAIFYLGVGYRDRPSGQRERLSVIRFRRLPAWSARELQSAAEQAEQLLRSFSEGA